jgi:hypothetical protein
MARTVAQLPSGTRITDFISVGVLTKTFPSTAIEAVLRETGKASIRQRDMPAHVVVYYVIALALYMQSSTREVLRCLLEGIEWLLGPGASIKVTGKSGISQARTRLGWEPIGHLHDQVVKPIAVASTKGAWYRRWRLVSLDGSTLDAADEPENDRVFGRPSASRGSSAFPQLRFVSLVENGTHVLFGTRMDGFKTGEITLAKDVLRALRPGMLCLADRNFYGFALWTQARVTEADLLWRVKQNLRLPCEQRLPDGSYLSRVYPSSKDLRHGVNGVVVRVIEYRLHDVAEADPLLPVVDDDPGSGRGTGHGTGRPVPRAVGDRNGAGRTQDPSARLPDRPAQQDARLGEAGVLRPDAGALCRPRADARSGARGGRRPGSLVVSSRGARRPTQPASIRRYSPLRTTPRFMRPFCASCSRTAWRPAVAGGAPVG